MVRSNFFEPGAKQLGRWLGHFLLFGGVWLLLSQFRVDFFLPGIPAAAVAAVSSTLIWRTNGPRLALAALPRYLLHFLWRSLVGGLDVAARAFHPRMPLSLGFLCYRFHSSDETEQVVFSDTVTLMPGTLVVRLDEKEALFHVLSTEASSRKALESEERYLHGLFPGARRDG